MITISIDVTLLDRKRFKEVTRQSGAIAKFCDLILIETPNGAHGDYMVKQDCTKEEREAKVQLPILGNGKIRGTGARPQGEHGGRSKPPVKRTPADDDDFS